MVLVVYLGNIRLKQHIVNTSMVMEFHLKFGLKEIFQSMLTSMIGTKKVVIGISGDSKDDLAFISDLLQRGEIRPVIDAHYPLDRIADAHRRVESRHKTGSVVVSVEQLDTIRLAAA